MHHTARPKHTTALFKLCIANMYTPTTKLTLMHIRVSFEALARTRIKIDPKAIMTIFYSPRLVAQQKREKNRRKIIRILVSAS